MKGKEQRTRGTGRRKGLRILGAVLAALALALGALALGNRIALGEEAKRLRPNGQLVDLGGYSVHVYAEGKNGRAPALVFLSGAGTVAPVYDFQPLYALLSDEYAVAVVEKAGYGYSDIAEVDRDVASMVEEDRAALAGAGIAPPYLLLPHSMSGLEALYWAQHYPREIAGIAGLDMAVPESYDGFDFTRVNVAFGLGRVAVGLGLHRIPGLYPLHTEGLSEAEREQQSLLMLRNAVNPVYALESEAVYDNAQTVKQGGAVDCPLLLFVSNGKETGEKVLASQIRFARENGARLVQYDCGHYLHYYKSSELAEEIRAFLREIG